MSETNYDITLRSWMERSARRVGAILPDIINPHASAALKLAVVLLEDSLIPYQKAIDRFQAEDTEALKAAEALTQAEATVDTAYQALWASCQARYYRAQAAPEVDAERLNTQPDPKMPLSPSVFAGLGLKRSRAHMKLAIAYGESMLSAEDIALEKARLAREHLDALLEFSDDEKADAIRATQRLFTARERARKAYIAARQFVDAALTLDADERLGQLMPTISSMYTSAPALADDEEDAPATAPV